MIKFFRKIRKNLLSEGKTGKYFKYAIGEIVLVVIGILIALQINNWNESIKLNAIKDNYLKRLLLDLETDEIYYNDVITRLESKLAGYNNYKKIYDEPDLNISKVITEITKVDYIHIEIEFKTSTIKTLISTGEIKLIPEILRNKLTSYNAAQRQVIMIARGNNESSKSILQDASKNGANADLLTRLQNQPEFSKYLDVKSNFRKLVLELDAAMAWKAFGENVTIDNFKSLIKDVNKITTIINKELEK